MPISLLIALTLVTAVDSAGGAQALPVYLLGPEGKLFVWTQVSNGRFKEVYHKYFGPGEVPSLITAGVDY